MNDELIALLRAIRPSYSDVGSRDVDTTASQKKIDHAIELLSASPPAAPAQSGEPVTIPGATLKKVLDALRFYGNEDNFQSVTFAQPERDNQLKRLCADPTWSEYMEDSRGHEQYRENGTIAQEAYDQFLQHFADDNNNFCGDVYDRMIAGEISLQASAPQPSQPAEGSEPTGDQVRLIIKSVGSFGTNHGDAPMEYVLAGWRAAKTAPSAVQAGGVCPDCHDGECYVDGSANCATKRAVALDDERAAFKAWFRDECDKRNLGVGDEAVAQSGWQARAAFPHPDDEVLPGEFGTADEMIAELHKGYQAPPLQTLLREVAALKRYDPNRNRGNSGRHIVLNIRSDLMEKIDAAIAQATATQTAQTELPLTFTPLYKKLMRGDVDICEAYLRLKVVGSCPTEEEFNTALAMFLANGDANG